MGIDTKSKKQQQQRAYHLQCVCERNNTRRSNKFSHVSPDSGGWWEVGQRQRRADGVTFFTTTHLHYFNWILWNRKKSLIICNWHTDYPYWRL